MARESISREQENCLIFSEWLRDPASATWTVGDRKKGTQREMFIMATEIISWEFP